MSKETIFSSRLRKFERVEAQRFTQGGFDFHIRKDFFFYGDRTKTWIITECGSGEVFAIGETALLALLLMDLFLVSFPKKHHDKSILNAKAQSFDSLIREFNYHGI